MSDKQGTTPIIEGSGLPAQTTIPLNILEAMGVMRTAEAALRIEKDVRQVLLDTVAEIAKAPPGATIGMNHAATHLERALRALETSRALNATTKTGAGHP
jgi:hypothetical protein